MATIKELKPVIRQIVQDVLRAEISDKLDKLENKVSELMAVTQTLKEHDQKLKDIQQSLSFTGDQIDVINKKTVPDLDKKFTELSTKMCLNLLNIDTHRRKWTLIINGLKGKSGESELETRAKVRTFAKDRLKVTGADAHTFRACHRLSQKDDAGIIVCFSDLYDKNEWLSNAKNLKHDNSSTSLSPDLHPCLRPLKTDILNIRKDLPPERRNLTTVKYLPTWPYICLKERGKSTVNPRITKEDIVQSFLDGVKLNPARISRSNP